MLRLAIRTAAALFLIVAAVMTVWQPANWLMLLAVVVGVVGVFYERRYTGMPTQQSGASGLQPTDERFVDPETGRLTVVHADPRTGERRYITTGEPPAGRP